MKKIILITIFVMLTNTNLFAQCAAEQPCTTIVNGYCSIPAYNTALPTGNIGLQYSQKIQITIPATIFGNNVTNATFNLANIAGLPAGLTITSSPANGVFPGGTTGCFIISGTPTTLGTFDLAVPVIVTAGFGNITGASKNGLTIGPALSADSFTNNSLFEMYPNPVTNVLNLKTNEPGEISIINQIGQVVKQINVTQEINNSIDLQSLQNGIYIVNFKNGTTLQSEKLIITN